MTQASKYSLLTFLGLMFVPLDGLSASRIWGAPAQHNVLFIAVDDLRTSLGCYGDTLVKSPNIDRLARQSRLFNRAYCHQAVCGPSRNSILTGRLPDNTRVWHNRNLFRDTLPDLVTLPEYFKNHGYHTQSLGKVFSGRDREEEQDPQSWSVPPLLKGPGWSNYALEENQGYSGKGVATEMADLPDEGYPDGKLAALAVETLRDLAERKQPFFLAVGFFKPHLPFCAPKKYWDLYDPDEFELSKHTGRTLNAPDVAYHEHHELGGYKDVPKDEKLDADQARHLRHGYYACVSYADAQVGKLLDALGRFGLEENTMVVFWGDHGYSLGEADHWCKGTNFEVDTRTPLMFRVPDLPEPGVATEAMMEYVDIYPTVVQLVGLPAAPDLDGTSLVPIVKDPRQEGRPFVLSQFARPFKPSPPEVMGYSVRTPTHRYTRWVRWPSREVLEEELYDYGSVRSAVSQGAFLVERENVSGDPAYRELRAQLSAMMDQTLQARTNCDLDYRTGIIGKLHVNPEEAFPFDLHEIRSANFARENLGDYAKYAEAFFTADERPFFLSINYPDAHGPWLKQVDGLPKDPLEPGDVQALTYLGIDPPPMREAIANHYNCMSRLDSLVGDLLVSLERSGEADNTLVVYFGDKEQGRKVQ